MVGYFLWQLFRNEVILACSLDEGSFSGHRLLLRVSMESLRLSSFFFFLVTENPSERSAL